MENIRPIGHDEIIKRDWRKVAVVALSVVLLALFVTLIQPFLYRTSLSIYVVQKSGFSIDAYSATKSEERLANKLAQVVYSSTFFEKVVKSDFGIEADYFPTDELQKRKKWAKTIEASAPAGLSRLDINVYHSDPKQALALAKSIGYVLLTYKNEFIGIPDVDLRILDTPLVSKYPVRPNIILNVFGSAIIGLLFGVFYVLIFYRPERDKLLAIPGSPKLVQYKNVAEAKLAEADVEQRVENAPEIKEIEEIKQIDLEAKMIDKVKEIAESEKNEEFALPNRAPEVDYLEDEKDLFAVSEQTVKNDFFPEIPDFNEVEKTVDIEKNKAKDLASFEDEDKIVAMPEK